MARLRIRSIYNNKWLDACNHPISFRSPDNRSWIPFDIKRMSLRDGGNLNWLEVDCKPDPLFDEPCAFKQIGSVNCPTGIDTGELGSGDGTGSGGLPFDLIEGYPAGYDLPDAGDTGFTLERAIGSPRGFALKRPALNYALEYYDPEGVTSNLGRGNYANPNYLWATTFSGGAQITETIYDLGQVAGWYEVIFASYDDVGISVDVYYLGQRIATTCGRIKDRYKIEFFFDALAGDGESRIMIRVRGQESTRWTYMVTGPKQMLSVYELDLEDPLHQVLILSDEYSGTPLFPAPCHATVFPRDYKTNDGKWFYEFHHYVGENADPNELALMVIDYTSWMNLDKFEVYHGGLRIGSTMDPKGLLGMIQFLWEPNRFSIPVPDLMIRVSAEVRTYGEDIMSWYYTLFCQNTPGYRENPWPCETPVAGLNSMGHGSTEDNYDMDNGVVNGVVSIKMTGYGDFPYTVTVFDIEGKLVAYTEGRRTTFTQFFIKAAEHGDTRKRIAVRIDAPIGSSWTYFVGCPVELLDIELDDKTIPVCNDEFEITVNDVQCVKSDFATFTVSSSLPVPNDVHVSVSTQDGTARSSGGAGSDYAGLPDIYGIFQDNDSPTETANFDSKTLRFGVQNWPNASVVFDNGWGNLANPEHKNAAATNDPSHIMGRNTNYYQNLETSSFANLSPDAKLVVNAWKHRLGDLTGKSWIILTDSADPAGDFSEICSNFVQSMINIYGLNVHVVRDDYSTQNFTPYDIITIANSRLWGERGQFSAAGVHYMARVFQGYKSPVGIAIADQVKQNRVLHCYFRATNQRLAQNILIRDVMNCFVGVKFYWNEQLTKNPIVPDVTLGRHLAQYPDTPLLTGISDAKADSDFTVLDVLYVAAPTTVDPDYVAKTEVVTIPTGATSAQVKVVTLNPAASPIGKNFFLNLTGTDSGTIVDPQGTATFANSNTTPSPVGDLNFSPSYFTSHSKNTWSDLYGVRVYGSAVGIAIDYSSYPTQTNPSGTPQPGKIAVVEANGGMGSQATLNKYYTAGDYPYDPALTYTYKWEYTIKFNDGNRDLKMTAISTTYDVLNKITTFGVTQADEKHSGSGYSLVVEAILWIKASNGVEMKSNLLTFNIVSDPIFAGGIIP